MSTTIESIRNGVDTQKLFATLDAVKAQPELGTFQFRVHNRWLGGAHNRSTIKGFYAAGGEDGSRDAAFELDAGEPPILIGENEAPNPAEQLMHALAACLTTSLVYVAAARGIRLTRVESRLEGDMDVRGALGLVGRRPQRLRADPCRRSMSRATRRPTSSASSWSARRRARRSTTSSRTACRCTSGWTRDRRRRRPDGPGAAPDLDRHADRRCRPGRPGAQPPSDGRRPRARCCSSGVASASAGTSGGTR